MSTKRLSSRPNPICLRSLLANALFQQRFRTEDIFNLLVAADFTLDRQRTVVSQRLQARQEAREVRLSFADRYFFA